MSLKFRQKVAVFLLMVYVPVVVTLGLQHHDGPLYPPKTGHHAVTHTNSKDLSPISLDRFCMACHFASRHFFEDPFHISSAIHDVAFLSAYQPYTLKQAFYHDSRKRGPPLSTIS